MNYNQCDDGNLDSEDGCDGDCNVETGWMCIGGKPRGAQPTVDWCSEICGDGVNRGWHTCDDGNLEDGDGCSANCITEVGFQCTGGGKETTDVCTEPCGDGINAGLLPCDDSNLLDGDGCSSTCQIETGWLCSGGSPTGPDTCYEICGDGLDLGEYGCDDGNLIDGDGCDQYCYIEPGYFCNDGEPEYCYKMFRPVITNVTISNDG